MFLWQPPRPQPGAGQERKGVAELHGQAGDNRIQFLESPIVLRIINRSKNPVQHQCGTLRVHQPAKDFKAIIPLLHIQKHDTFGWSEITELAGEFLLRGISGLDRLFDQQPGELGPLDQLKPPLPGKGFAEPVIDVI